MPPADPQLQNIGRESGLEIWRIKNFALEKLAKEEHGSFYTGDSYIVLHTKCPGEWDVHFWLGKETTADERGTAAIKTVELDDALGGLPVQHREVQDHESALFLSYFKQGIKYLKGGAESGMKHVGNKYENWKPRLFHCKGKRNVRCTEVECNRSSLNLGDVFILDCGKEIYVWMPPESGRLERIKGMEQGISIRDRERAGQPKVEALDQDWNTNARFWNVMGGNDNLENLKSAAAGGADDNFWLCNGQQISLWRVCDEKAEAITKVSEGVFKSEMLDSKDAFILDAVNGGVFVWIGKKCTMNERQKAMQFAQKYIQDQGRPPYTHVVRVLEGAEPAIFTQWASAWERGEAKAKPKFQPKLFHCSDESGRLVVEEIANFSQKDLDTDDVMILDGLDVIYVWAGKDANMNELKHAKETAQKYLKANLIPRPATAAIEVLFQGSETPAFKQYFKNWQAM